MKKSVSPGRKREGTGAVSMATVARAAGVSAQTVSRVLAGHPSVRDETRQAVLTAVRDSGYRVNRAAASLSSGRTRILGIVTLQSANYSLGALMTGMDRAASESGYFVTSAAARSTSAEGTAAAFDRLVSQGAEGIVLAVPTPLSGALLQERARLPIITIDPGESSELAAVTVDQHAIGAVATEHLLGLGHATVWHVSGRPEWTESHEREAGWRAALSAAGRDAPPVLRGDWSPESGYQAGRTLARIPDATAVFVASDEMAFGVIRALHESGRRVPDDVSVVGVDDIPLAEYAAPALTSVRQPFERIGFDAASMAIALIEGHPAGSSSRLAPELVQRASTAPPGLTTQG